jgi:hypothetical protein
VNHRTLTAVQELQAALVAEYRLTVAGRGIAEAEFASRQSVEALASVRHWIAKVQAMETARVALSLLRQTLEAV